MNATRLGRQIRAARALAGWKQTDLASASGLSEMTVKKIENGATPDPRMSTVGALRRALENAGVEFIGDTGVNLRQT